VKKGLKALPLKEPPMAWYAGYLVIAAVVAVATFVSACWFREEHVAAPDNPGVIAALAGMLWPVLLVGMSEMALVWWAFRGARFA
jgi:hypothetical protein